MAKITLTRFDFHAYDFLHSDAVRAMSVKEVGQYILLLCEAWCGGKSATLPANPQVLAVYARGPVSEFVMGQFQLVETEWGQRWRNKTLTREWDAAMTRSQKKRNAAEMRWGCSSNADAMQVHKNADALHMPNPTQAVPIQTEPSQTEPEDDTMSMKKRINESAGSKIVDQRNSAEFDLLARKYGKETVIADFEIWYGTTDGLLQYPGSAYLKIADSRLQSDAQSAIIQSDPRINEIVAFVFTVSQQAPRGADVAELLADYSQEEIQDAFKAYTDNLDEFGLKGSARTFFKDGAGAGIILARRQKKAADVALEASTKASIKTGLESRRAEADARKKRMDEEQQLADQLGDKPF